MSTKWFRIDSGEHAGKVHLSGWMISAFATVDGFVGFANCPRCRAMVATDGAYGDLTWAHERWHAETDFPVPEELRQAEVTP